MPVKINTETYITKASKVHGGRYDYSPTSYVNSRTKIKIRCEHHGLFSVYPNKHLQGNGCPICHNKGRLNPERFIESAIAKHGDTYIYTPTKYETARQKVLIECKDHGLFSIYPNKHLQGDGCPICHNNGRSTHDEFVRRVRQIHGDKYCCDELMYVNSRTRVSLTCPEHGEFSVLASKLLQGNGCPKCSTKRGFNSDNVSYTYFLLDIDTYSRVKIGVSNKPEQRFMMLKKSTPFNIARIDLFETPPKLTLQIEKFCHSQMKNSKLRGFDGATEWFEFDGATLESLRSFIKSCGGVTT